MPPNRRNPRPSTSSSTPARRPRVAGAPRPSASQPDAAVEKAAAPEVTPEVKRPRKVPLVKRGSGSSLRRADEQATEITPLEDTPDAAGSSGRASSRWKPAAILAAIAVVLGAFAVVAAFKPGGDVSNEAYVDNAATDEVKAAVKNSLTTLYAYDDAKIDAYPAAARSVITDQMRTEFDKTVDQTVSAVKQAKTKTEAQVDPVGVTLLDDDRAELLVNLTVSASNNGVAQQSAAGPVVVRMSKVNGTWLASQIIDR